MACRQKPFNLSSVAVVLVDAGFSSLKKYDSARVDEDELRDRPSPRYLGRANEEGLEEWTSKLECEQGDRRYCITISKG